MESNSMKCRDVYLHICDNLDQKLNSRQCLEVKRHLGMCPDCKVYLDSLKKTVHLYRTTLAPDVTARTHRKLLKAIDLAWNTAPREKEKISSDRVMVRRKAR